MYSSGQASRYMGRDNETDTNEKGIARRLPAAAAAGIHTWHGLPSWWDRHGPTRREEQCTYQQAFLSGTGLFCVSIIQHKSGRWVVCRGIQTTFLQLLIIVCSPTRPDQAACMCTWRVKPVHVCFCCALLQPLLGLLLLPLLCFCCVPCR